VEDARKESQHATCYAKIVKIIMTNSINCGGRMDDPVIVDLNRYLLEQEEALDEEEELLAQQYRDRYVAAQNILKADISEDMKIRRLISWVEDEVEEGQGAYF
jgi:hypothetical protein